MEIWVSIAALTISAVSLVLSFLQGYEKILISHEIKINPLKDEYDLLFNDNNKADVELVNYNNRDILLFLKEGYVDVNGLKHPLKQAYYTAKANSVTKAQIEILTEASSSMNRKSKEGKVYMVFQYKWLVFKLNCKLMGAQND